MKDAASRAAGSRCQPGADALSLWCFPEERVHVVQFAAALVGPALGNRDRFGFHSQPSLLTDTQVERNADEIGDLAAKFDRSLCRSIDQVRNAEVLFRRHLERQALKAAPAVSANLASTEAEPRLRYVRPVRR